MVPDHPKIYHIVHIDRLSSIVNDGYLWSHSVIIERNSSGTDIGMDRIKQRRLHKPLSSHGDLMVGECVPFYFCPRSVMLYLIYRGNHPDLAYRDGQETIVHLETSLFSVVSWANCNGTRWAFTKSNAGSAYFEDYCELEYLNELNWQAIQTNQWYSPSTKEAKQAEFLVEKQFPWQLIERITVPSEQLYRKVLTALHTASHTPDISVNREYYY